MNDKILELSSELIKRFIINIRQIISNSDNEMSDIENEAYIITHEHYDSILNNERVFINEMRKKCLRNNKYGKRIESIDRWEYFNSLESSIPERTKITSEINEDLIVGIDAFLVMNFYGFSKKHKIREFEEFMEFKKVKDYITDRYGYI